jgi:ABC-type enterochelin transport system permease subunit
MFDQSGGQNPGTLSMSERIVGMSLVVLCRIIFRIITEPSEALPVEQPLQQT